MAFLKYAIKSEIKKIDLLPTEGPGRTVAIIGSRTGDKVLCLPNTPSIMAEHAIIIEAKKMSFFVLLDRSDGNTYVNGSRVTWLKILRHKDIITVGDINTENRVDLTFYEVEIQQLPGDSTCSICDRAIKKGEKIFRCPKCSHIKKNIIYCKKCFLDSQFENCGCGYAVHSVVNNALLTTKIKKILPAAKASRLKFERVEPGSELLKKECRSIWDAEHIVSRFHKEDEVIFCPLCDAPYHRDCWVNLETCANPQCKCSIEELIFKILSPA